MTRGRQALPVSHWGGLKTKHFLPRQFQLNTTAVAIAFEQMIDAKVVIQQDRDRETRRTNHQMLELEKQIYDLILKVVFLKNRVKGILRLNQLV